MIQTIITHKCPDCGSQDIVKNGHDYKGTQKFHCKSCNRYGALHAQKGYHIERQEQVKRALLERVSLRGIGRIFKMSRHTVSHWLEHWLEEQRPISQTHDEAAWEDVLELDELWSFVGNKEQKRWLYVVVLGKSLLTGLAIEAKIVQYAYGNTSLMTIDTALPLATVGEPMS